MERVSLRICDLLCRRFWLFVQLACQSEIQQNRATGTAERIGGGCNRTPATGPDSVACASLRLYSDIAFLMASSSSGASGFTGLGKKATILPCLSITYLLKFHFGRLPEVPRNL